MISFLKGKILNIGEGYIIVITNNVGYKIFINTAMQDNVNISQEIEIYTHQNVREDALDLYGFNNLEELEMFELLLSISGIGPKSALGVLAIASVTNIKESISQGDSALLTKVSGIGRKTAERVVLELREKIGQVRDIKQEITGGIGKASGEEIDALMALGYSMPQARDVLRMVDVDIKDSGERIKAALKKLSK